MLNKDNEIERNLGEQPLRQVMLGRKLKPQDLVARSEEQLTHKMVNRAMKGRRLTPRVKLKVLNALNSAAGKEYSLEDIFTY